MNIKKRNYQNTDLIYIRLVYFLFFNNYFELHPDLVKETTLFLNTIFTS